MTARLVGALLLAAGGAGLGWTAGARLRERAALLDGLRAGLETLRREIGFCQASVPEALVQAAASAHARAADFFALCARQLAGCGGTTVGEAWRRGIEGTLTGLSPEDRAALLQLGGVLGRFDGATQCRALEQCEARLERARLSALEDWRREKRAYLALGGAAGALAALLLL